MCVDFSTLSAPSILTCMHKVTTTNCNIFLYENDIQYSIVGLASLPLLLCPILFVSLLMCHSHVATSPLSVCCTLLLLLTRLCCDFHRDRHSDILSRIHKYTYLSPFLLSYPQVLQALQAVLHRPFVHSYTVKLLFSISLTLALSFACTLSFTFAIVLNSIFSTSTTPISNSFTALPVHSCRHTRLHCRNLSVF